MNNIHVIGDSHVSVFSKKNIIIPEYPPNIYMNFPFKIFRIGAPLAYNLGKRETYYNAREKIEHVFKHEIIKGDSIILSFGEIDCRYHLLKQSKLQEKDIEEVIVECVERYVQSVKEIVKDNFYWINKIGFWGPIASTWLGDECSNKDCPIADRMPMRNFVTSKFNTILKDKIDKFNKEFWKTNFYYLSIFEFLIDDKYFTKKEYYMDNIHLNQKTWPLIENELKEKGFLNREKGFLTNG